MPRIRIPHIADGSLDINGVRRPVIDHVIEVHVQEMGIVLSNVPKAEILPDVPEA